MMEKQISILDMAERSLPRAWERCVNAALQAKIVVEDEIEKSKNAHVGPFFNTTQFSSVNAHDRHLPTDRSHQEDIRLRALHEGVHCVLTSRRFT